MQHLVTFRRRFDPLFASHVQKKIDASKNVVRDALLRTILTYSGKVIFHGGKRIRPYLADVGFRCLERESPRSVLPLFSALELFHLFALVHDDIMDKGTSRHGIPTIHRHIAQLPQIRSQARDAAHLGESQAILVGDLFFSWSQELMLATPASISATALKKARTLFSRMLEQVILGQMIDMHLTTKRTALFPTLKRKMLLKTASYSIIKPLQIGAALAGGSDRLLSLLGSFGTALGLAFQVQDDLFDLTVPQAQSKKTVFSDITDKQHTVFTWFLLQKGSAKQKRSFRRMFGEVLVETDRAAVMKVFGESGALSYGKHLLKKYFLQAERSARQLPISSAMQTEVLMFVDFVKQRTA